MSATNPSGEQVGTAAVYFGAIGAAIKRGAEIDDAKSGGLKPRGEPVEMPKPSCIMLLP